MTDNTDLIAELQAKAERLRTADTQPYTVGLLLAVADALAARDAACGHQSNELVAKALAWAAAYGRTGPPWLTDDEVDALRAATFEVTE